MILPTGTDAAPMGLRLDQTRTSTSLASRPQRGVAADAPGEIGVTLRFDRRREARARTGGWARLICYDPYKSFLGGTVELVDISHSGFGFRSARPLPVGEYVEVRLAPFRVRGRAAMVTRCDEVPALLDEQTGAELHPKHYRIGVRHAQSIRAA